MDWSTLPYNHNGKWEKVYDSIMSPGTKITWPQLIVEILIQNRTIYIKAFPRITRGEGWSVPISKQVRSLVQQAYVITNYFPHPNDDQSVVDIIRAYLIKNRIMKIGGYRKTRLTKTGKCNITQDEKDIVKSLQFYYEKHKASLKVHQEVIEAPKVEVKFNTETYQKNKKKSLFELANSQAYKGT